jgi:hypothetical protein
MSTRLLLTIGMNPLPVLVAAYRLCCHFKEADLPAITAIFSSGSEEEARKVKHHLERKLGEEGHPDQEYTLQWKEARVSPWDPDSILREVRSGVEGSTEPLHLHYTGGTKAMAAHAMQVLVVMADRPVSTSYLDINDHRLRCWNLASFTAPRDERRAWPELTAEDIAQIHGMTVSSPGSVPDSPVLEAAATLYACVTQHEKAYSQWQCWKEKTWRASFRDDKGNQYQGWPDPPPWKYWPNQPIPWPTVSALGWERVANGLNAALSPDPAKPALCRSANGGWIINVRHFESRKNRKPFVEFLEYKALEYYVFGEMNKLVPGKTFHSFRARSSGATSDCEIDVAASLGYQFIAVSCTEAAERRVIKSKGFEAWHRARQIGGDGARAVVVCPAADSPCSNARADEIEKDLADDVGLRDAEGRRLLPVRFFGFKKMRDGGFRQALARFLQEDLNWSVSEGAEA